ncbi:MAG: MCE family protein [Armatimonadetes bacterium]|nr:MCE family protein [Armatimonadota bacterium]
MSSALMKVGALALLVGVLAVVVALYMGGVWAKLGTYEIYVRMPDAGGVDAGADVMMSGVRIGVVSRVDLEPDETHWPGRPVRMALAIHKQYRIPREYHIGVDQGGLLASRYISIEPPRPEKGVHARVVGPGAKAYLPPGEEVPGEGLRGLAALGQMSDQLSKRIPAMAEDLQAKLDHLAERAEATYLSKDHERLVHEIMVNMSQMTASANRAARSVERIAATLQVTTSRGSPEVVAMVKELRIAAVNVRKTAEQVHRIVSVSTVPNDLAVTMSHVKKAASAMEETTDAVRDMVTSDETQLRFRELTANMARISAAMADLTEQVDALAADPRLQTDIKQSVSDLHATMSSLRETAEHLQKVLTDKQMTEDLKATVHNLRGLTEQGRQVAQKANASLDRVDHTMDRLSSAVQSIRPRAVRGNLDVFGIRDEGARADLDLDLFYGDKPRPGFWRIGIFDVGDAERVNFQRGIPLSGPWDLRLGIFANKAGLGLDWHPGSWRGEIELYDPDETYLDLTLFHSLRKDWQLGFGIRDAFGENNPFVGVRRTFNLSGEQPEDTSTP